jgi:VanZ family protein
VKLLNPTTSHALGDPARRQITSWIAVVGWAAVIFYLSSLSRLPPAVSTWSLTKLAHIIEYAVLTLLLMRALDAHHLGRRRVLWMAALLAVAYAVTDEFHQSFVPNRHPSPLDIVIDFIGISAASLLGSVMYQQRRHRGAR